MHQHTLFHAELMLTASFELRRRLPARCCDSIRSGDCHQIHRLAPMRRRLAVRCVSRLAKGRIMPVTTPRPKQFPPQHRVMHHYCFVLDTLCIESLTKHGDPHLATFDLCLG
jgi:hypothetical protein